MGRMSDIPESPSFDKTGEVPADAAPQAASAPHTAYGWTNGVSRGLQDLRRSLADRKIAGVCGGLGRASGVDPLIYRVVLVVLTLFAGVGVVAYGVAWLLIPEDGQAESLGERLVRGRADGSVVAPLVVTLIGLPIVGGFAGAGFGPGFLVVLTVVGVIVIVGLRGDRPPPRQAGSTAAPFPAWSAMPQEAGGSTVYTASMPEAPAYAQPFAPHGPYAAAAAPDPPPMAKPPKPARQHSALGALALSSSFLVGGVLWAADLDMNTKRHAQVVLAAVLVVLAVGLLVGTFAGRARWLVLPGIALMIALLVVSSVPNDLPSGVGERTWHPVDAQQAQLHTYELGAGQGHLDLRDLHPGPGERIVARTRMGVGELLVIVPNDVSIELTTKQRIGQTRLPDGVSVQNEYVTQRFPGSSSTGTLVLDLTLRIGDLEVRRATS